MENDFDFEQRLNDPMFNPIMQYEQAFMYYKYLTQQLDYKIKYKEYEKLCKSDERPLNRRVD